MIEGPEYIQFRACSLLPINPSRGSNIVKAVKVSTGRCKISGCDKPAVYKQILAAGGPNGQKLLFCEEHASEAVKKAAEREEKAQNASH
jgi:hypothetical protein